MDYESGLMSDFSLSAQYITVKGTGFRFIFDFSVMVYPRVERGQALRPIAPDGNCAPSRRWTGRPPGEVGQSTIRTSAGEREDSTPSCSFHHIVSQSHSADTSASHIPPRVNADREAPRSVEKRREAS